MLSMGNLTGLGHAVHHHRSWPLDLFCSTVIHTQFTFASTCRM
jgi:hypothetical protein